MFVMREEKRRDDETCISAAETNDLFKIYVSGQCTMSSVGMKGT
jgi:hypothetical protein